jgi:predicted outer membrane repeat protein
MRLVHFVAILVLLVLVLPAAPAHAGGVVAICDEAHLRAALTGGGTVTFSCSGYITLANTITVSANTTIDGSGQSVTISGSDSVRVFTVNSEITLSLVGLTIREGNDTSSLGGGGVLANGGNVSINNCLFADTSAIFGGGVMVYNGALTVVNSTFSGESGSIGGAIAGYDAKLTVSNSTFSMNSAPSSPVADGSGGAIYAEGGTLTVSNSTIHRNSATTNGGGIAGDNATVTLINCTFFNNTAGVGGNSLEQSGSGSMTLKNTILYNNLPGANCAGSMTDGGNNLSYSDATCPGIHRNPLLQTLNSNGGPTFTMLLGLGSPAIDAGNDAVCAAAPINHLDQRGAARPQGAHCDIGSVEQKPYSTPQGLSIDIKPDGGANSINCRNKNQVITVAILTTGAPEAAAIDHRTVSFEGAVETHADKKTGEPARHEEDVDRDGDMDLVFHFRLGSTGLTCDSTEGTLLGQTFAGEPFMGTDSVRMVR